MYRSSLLSFLVINLIQGFTFDYNTCVLNYNTYSI